ncbi:MAG: glycerophosphodiester phosphodiesterase family protein [Vicingaceae bacterium]|nr:glycerophosphodiester phosphodiesterase family protein [Vicingaceae bacterium]
MNFKLITLLLLLSFSFSCNKEENLVINNLNNGVIFGIGHGGIGLQSIYNQLPENSMASIKKAIEVYNTDGVEVDVQMTKDYKLVLYHDNKLETSTNGYGFIYEHNLTELSDIKFDKDVYVNVFLNEKILSFSTLLAYLSNRKYPPQLHLDLRQWLYDKSIHTSNEFFFIYATEIVNLIYRYNYQQHTFINSSDLDLLKIFKGLDASLNLTIESNDIYYASDLAKENNLYGIVANDKLITKSDIDYAHSKNVKVMLFNMRSQFSINSHPLKSIQHIVC